MTKKPCWIGVAGKDQMMIGVKGGFAQLQHSRKIPLQKINDGDWLIDYSPRRRSTSQEPCQSFTAPGRIASREDFSFDVSTGLVPYQLDEDFALCDEATILPVPDRLPFIEDKKSWGYLFRLEHVEIGEEDFELLVEEMGLEVDAIKH